MGIGVLIIPLLFLFVLQSNDWLLDLQEIHRSPSQKPKSMVIHPRFQCHTRVANQKM
jgi:hypothetical protein